MAALPLLLGIKRRIFRGKDAQKERERADIELAAKRRRILEKEGFVCAACGYESKVVDTGPMNQRKPSYLDIHHADDDHRNNKDENLRPACHTCHPYQHVGEVSARTDAKGSDGVNAESVGKTLIAAIPEISPSDLNLWQRAIGYALACGDEQEERIAKRMIEALAVRADRVRMEFGTHHARDFAAAMSVLNDSEYAAREDAISDLRLLFNVKTLKALGQEMKADYSSLGIKTWASVAQRVSQQSQSGSK